MKHLLLTFILVSTSIALGQDFQKCVTNTRFHFINTKTFDVSPLDRVPPPDEKWLFGDDKSLPDYELGDLSKSPEFKRELAAARTEVRGQM